MQKSYVYRFYVDLDRVFNHAYNISCFSYIFLLWNKSIFSMNYVQSKNGSKKIVSGWNIAVKSFINRFCYTNSEFLYQKRIFFYFQSPEKIFINDEYQNYNIILYPSRESYLQVNFRGFLFKRDCYICANSPLFDQKSSYQLMSFL